jgi:osmotically-inducible protein OsmY
MADKSEEAISLRVRGNPGLGSNGRVTLFGMTSSGGLRAKAEKLTQAIAGVSHIENCIISIPNRGNGFLTSHGRLP